MSTRTLTDLAIETLEKLGILPDGQTPSSEDTARVEEAIPTILEELAAREIVFVADSNNIPSAWFMPLANICAYETIEKFGLTGDEAAALQTRNDEAIKKLKSILRGRPTGEPMRTQYF
jgi:hypothetical protein